MKVNYLKLLTENCVDLPAFYDIHILHRAAVNAGSSLSYEEFYIDLLKFLKTKKVSEFVVLPNDKLKIVKFGSFSCFEMLKYFKIGVDVISIDSNVLYKSWKNKIDKDGNEKTLNDFMKEFKNTMASLGREDTYFIFETQLTFQKH